MICHIPTSPHTATTTAQIHSSHVALNATTSATFWPLQDNLFSPPFTVSNDVVLSPILLCVYIDNSLHSLAKSSIGCFTGRVFVGTLVYAVDIVLLSPTASSMWTLLHVCDFSVVFNAAKSKYLGFKLGASLLHTIIVSERVFSVVVYWRQTILICLLILYAFLDANT